MKSWRASDRARGIVDRAWAEVVAEEERLKMGRQGLRVVVDRDGRRVGRRVRKLAGVGRRRNTSNSTLIPPSMTKSLFFLPILNISIKVSYTLP